MHAIRFHLRAPERPEDHPTAPPSPSPPTPAPALVTPSPEAVRDALARALPAPARLEHTRILVGPGTVDGVAFLLADNLLAAEAAVTVACTTLTGPAGPLPGWQVPHCTLDTLLALGLHDLPTYP
ncbi:hypothetical protein AB0O91_34700 [Kitasatospora sp. NPDC089797]|uniref:hypothetical protein n=1 Tax=Kitasatospora sp. NPDC089797 TaxID=3155298 RepID=UPI00343A7148